MNGSFVTAWDNRSHSRKSVFPQGIPIGQGNTTYLDMDTLKVKTCFTITFTDEQYSRAKGYIEDMKRHPGRIFWQGKQGKSDDELIIEQIAHRILSGFYNNESYNAAKYIMRMDSSVKV